MEIVKINNPLLLQLYDFCNLMIADEEQTSFDSGYNYAFAIMQTRLITMDKYLDKNTVAGILSNATIVKEK